MLIAFGLFIISWSTIFFGQFKPKFNYPLVNNIAFVVGSFCFAIFFCRLAATSIIILPYVLICNLLGPFLGLTFGSCIVKDETAPDTKVLLYCMLMNFLF